MALQFYFDAVEKNLSNIFDYVFIKHNESQYTTCNEKYASIVGLEDKNDIHNIENTQLPGFKISNTQEASFIKQNIITLSGETLKMLDVHNYCGKFRFLITHKYPLSIANRTIGFIGCVNEINQSAIKEINIVLGNSNIIKTQ